MTSVSTLRHQRSRSVLTKSSDGLPAEPVPPGLAAWQRQRQVVGQIHNPIVPVMAVEPAFTQRSSSRRARETAIAHAAKQCRPPRPSARTAASAAACWPMSRTDGSSACAATATIPPTAGAPAASRSACRSPSTRPIARRCRCGATTATRASSRPAGRTCSARVAGRLRAIIDEHGPDAVAFYISGQLLTEDYYAINKLAKGFLGTNNVDSNSRLCMSSAVAGYSGAFGYDGPPPAYADIALADCFLLLGHEHRGLPSDPLVAHPRPPGRGRVRHLRRPARDADRAALGPAPAGAPGHRPRAAERDAARRRPRRPARRALRRTPHERLGGGAGGRARVVARARRGRLRRSRPSSSRTPRTASPAPAARWRCGRWAPTSRPSGR